MILDPSKPIEPSDVTGSINRADVPSLTDEQDKFGYLPNVENIIPGDLILSQTVSETGKFEARIKEAQRLKYPNHYQWTPAAIYAQKWRVVEATPENDVSDGDIVSWIPSCKIMVRRPIAFQQMEASEVLVTGLEMALEAAMLQKKSHLWHRHGVRDVALASRQAKTYI